MAGEIKSEYIAHVQEDGKGWRHHPLADHLAGVSALAACFARNIGEDYGLYRAHGFISAHLARQTGFDSDDLELFFKALEQMFEHDRSAARGEMAARGLYVFRHESELGNAPAHALFDRLTVERQGDDVARDFGAYSVLFDGQPVAVGEHKIADQPNVTLIRRC